MADQQTPPYRVLARKYRPRHFDELVGQDALVRTLRNAIESGRIAHAFMLTGVRGVGKTTTARIIAKALNYTGPDGTAGPTTGPTDDCQICRAIAEDRHPDVMEMDAASRTGVDDIREILDGVRYAPVSARYKIYIIDEVHMLSKNAFNALLKTLEEPPPHVKFIFATTEIRKVPVTVLSRCQRFDLRRIDAATLAAYYKTICEREEVAAEDEAIAMIARAADGSARDGLSLLDQSIALGSGKVTAQQVKDMLGMADRSLVYDLLDAALSGNAARALELSDDLYNKGADPGVLLQDLLEACHVLSRLKAVPGGGFRQMAISPDLLARADAMGARLSIPALGRAWQVLLKGLAEVNHASSPRAAAEMVLIRLLYAADLPDPADLLRRIRKEGGEQPAGHSSSAPRSERAREPAMLQSVAHGGAATAVRYEPEAQAVPAAQAAVALDSLREIVSFLAQKGEVVLSSQVWQYAHLTKFAAGRLEIRPAENAPQKMAQDLGQKLSAHSGTRWIVTVSGVAGEPTLAQQDEAARQAQLDTAREHEVVRGILEIFPDAEVIRVYNPETDPDGKGQ